MVADLVFYSIAAFMVACALLVVLDKNVFHNAVFLTLSFLGFGILYFLLDAALVGVIQILIYAGAVTMLLMFVIMLTKPQHAQAQGLLSPLKGQGLFNILMFLVAVGIAAIIISQVLPVQWRTSIPGETFEQPDKSVAAIGLLLLGQFALPFEVVSVVLLAALIGAIVLARTDDVGGEGK